MFGRESSWRCWGIRMNYDKQRPVGNQKLDPAELWLVIGEYFESEQNGCRWDWFITIFWGPDAFE